MLRLLFCLTLFVLYKAALSTNPAVIIVGAGPAGIAAATKLLENSINNIKIYEAESRIGGRIKSVKFGDGYVDEGAEYCDGEGGNIVYELVKDLDLIEPSGSIADLTNHLYYSNGSTFDSALTEDINTVILKYRNFGDDYNVTGISIGEAFVKKYNNTILKKYSNDKEKLKIALEGMTFAKNFILTSEGTFSWDIPSAKRHYVPCEGKQLIPWKKEGFKIILDVMTKSYPDPGQKLPIDDKIILNERIVQIIWNDNGVTVKTSKNTSTSADHVIFTPSVGVLKEQETLFEPVLPQSKKKAIEALGFEGSMKIFLHFPKKWWQYEDGIFHFLWSDEDLKKATEEFPHGPSRNGRSWVTHITTLLPVAANPAALVAWVSGDLLPDLEQTPKEILLNGSMYVINKFLGRDYNVTTANSVTRSDWCSNPSFRGTYIYEKNGYFEEDISYQAKLAEPVKNNQGKPIILFAGEATSPKHYGSVHGAIETGYREAERIISLYKGK